MKKLVCCLVGLVTSLPLPAQSGTDYSSSSLKQRRECATQLQERSFAITMRDWTLLDQSGRAYIESCSALSERADLAKAYGAVASANNEMGQYREALDQAQAGITADYLETSNHLEKVRALFALNRSIEAKEALEDADHVIHLAIKLNDAHMETAHNDHERESYKEESNRHRAQCMVLEEYRVLLALIRD